MNTLTLYRLNRKISEDKIMNNGVYLPEKRVKHVLESFLTSRGWNCENASVTNNSSNIVAKRATDKWVIVIRGSVYRSHTILNSFASALGEILQRMDDMNCKYSVALPNTKPFCRLWERLPKPAKNRLGITVLFVDQTGTVEEVSE